MLTAVPFAPVQVSSRRHSGDSTEQRTAGTAGPLLARELRRAAAECAAGRRDELRVFFQPVVELNTELGRRPRRQLEALLRWKHPTRGILDATDFLPLAERSELITGIGTAMLTHACALAAAWQDPAVDSSVVVNVSAAELSSPGFADRVRGVLRATRADPSWLGMEVTERALVGAGGRAAATMTELEKLGVRWSLDDVAAQLSLPGLARRYPIGSVKLSRGLVARLGDRRGGARVGGVVFLARVLGMEVVAAGVETREQLRQLSLLGCDRAQGHLLGVPIDPTVADLPVTSDVADIEIPRDTASTAPASLRSIADPPEKARVCVGTRP